MAGARARPQRLAGVAESRQEPDALRLRRLGRPADLEAGLGVAGQQSRDAEPESRCRSRRPGQRAASRGRGQQAPRLTDLAASSAASPASSGP